MLNGMLSSFRPSKRLAEAPEPTSGAFSIMVSPHGQSGERHSVRDAGSIDDLIMGSRSASYSGRLTGLLASLRRAYPGTRAFVTSFRTSSGGLRTCHPTRGPLSARKRLKCIFRQSSERRKFIIRIRSPHRCRPRCRRPTSVRTACVTQLDHRRRDSDQCRLWVKLRRT